MTYVCGYQDNKINFIICDTRITWRTQGATKSSIDVAVKSGKLFRGCIFARTGNMQSSAHFIRAAKERARKLATAAECWQKFRDLIDEYPFPKAQFSILLSTRAFGKPEFYVLDSKEGLARSDHKFVGLGSGVPLLNSVMERDLKLLEDFRAKIPDDFQDQNPVDLSGYRMCQVLTLYSQSQEMSLMAQYDVGGIFHFVAQDNGREYRQRPSLYIIAVFNPKDRSIYLWMYRIIPLKGGLIVETYLPPKQDTKHPLGGLGRDSYFDILTTPEIQEVLQGGKVGKRFHRQLISELDSTEFYYYLGWGFAHGGYRPNFGWQFRLEGDKALVTREGSVDQTIATEILKQIRSTTNIRGSVTVYFANKNLKALQTNI